MRGRRRLRSHLLALVVLAALALPGSAAVAQSPSPDASAAPSVAASPAPSAGPASVTVRLVDNGRKPRAVRTYAFVAGTVQTVEMDVTQRLTTTIAGSSEQTVDLPTIRYTMTTTVDAVDADGMTTMTTRIDAITVLDTPEAEEPLDPATISQLDETLQGLVGATFTGVSAPNGLTLSTSADLSAVDPAIAQQMTGIMDQLAQQSQVFPDAPIGRGARWIMSSTITANGITFRNRQTLTLKAIEGSRLAIAVQIKQTGIPGPVDLPGLPAGTTAEVVELDGQGANRAIVVLDQPFPAQVGSSTVRVKLTATDGTQTQSTTSTVITQVAIRLVDAPVASPGASPTPDGSPAPSALALGG